MHVLIILWHMVNNKVIISIYCALNILFLLGKRYYLVCLLKLLYVTILNVTKAVFKRK